VCEEARRYLPHFVRPFALHMILGERKTPLSVLRPSGRYPHVEALSEARTKPGKGAALGKEAVLAVSWRMRYPPGLGG